MRTTPFLLLTLAGMIACGDKDDEDTGTGEGDTDTDSDTDSDTDTDTDTDTDPPTGCAAEESGYICQWMGVEGTALFADLEGEPRTESFLNLPLDLTFGADGVAYVVDWNNHRVRAVHTDSTVHTLLGVGVIGDGVFDPGTGTWSDGLGLEFKINHPSQVIFDPSDDSYLYIAAWHNSRIERYNFATGEVEYFAGTGLRTYSDNADPMLASFDLPSSIAFDDSGNIYVSDQANTLIRKIDDAGVTSYAGVLKSFGYNGDGPKSEVEFAATAGQLADPSNRLEYFEGALYFVDTESNLVRKLDLTTEMVTTIAGVYEENPVLQDTNADGIGDLVVGLGAYAGDGGPAIEARLNRPRDLTLAPDGTIYVADTDNHCVRVITPDGMIDTFAGTCGVEHLVVPPSTTSMAHDMPATEAQLSHPFGVALDAEGNLYVADTWNHVFRVVYK